MIARTIERDVSAIVQEAVEKHGAKRDALIPILSDVNKALGYIPAEAFQEVQKQLNAEEEHTYVSKSQLFGLASFYDMLSTKPRGRHVVKFCENAPCHVVGGKSVWDTLRVLPADTSARRLRLFAVACCRRLPGLAGRSVRAQDVAERHAEGSVDPDALLRAYMTAGKGVSRPAITRHNKP